MSSGDCRRQRDKYLLHQIIYFSQYRTQPKLEWEQDKEQTHHGLSPMKMKISTRTACAAAAAAAAARSEIEPIAAAAAAVAAAVAAASSPASLAAMGQELRETLVALAPAAVVAVAAAPAGVLQGVAPSPAEEISSAKWSRRPSLLPSSSSLTRPPPRPDCLAPPPPWTSPSPPGQRARSGSAPPEGTAGRGTDRTG